MAGPTGNWPSSFQQGPSGCVGSVWVWPAAATPTAARLLRSPTFSLLDCHRTSQASGQQPDNASSMRRRGPLHASSGTHGEKLPPTLSPWHLLACAERDGSGAQQLRRRCCLDTGAVPDPSQPLDSYPTHVCSRTRRLHGSSCWPGILVYYSWGVPLARPVVDVDGRTTHSLSRCFNSSNIIFTRCRWPTYERKIPIQVPPLSSLSSLCMCTCLGFHLYSCLPYFTLT